jgi:transglutaminase-like putative cysteine protease
MKPPRFLLGLGLALWGSCADVLWLGALLGVLVEAVRMLNPRMRFDVADFNRVSDFGTVLSISAIGYFAATLGVSQGVLRAVVWLPVTVAPVLLAQLASETGRLRLRNLFYSLRKSELPEADRPVDVAYAYFALCMVSASIAVNDYAVFLPVAAALVAYALFGVRAPGRTAWAWALAVVLALALGTATSIGVKRLQLALEDIAFEWLSTTQTDPYRSTTRIGDVGRIKLSDAIVWRVRTERPVASELLLFEAAYTIFDGNAWRAPTERFAPLVGPAEGGSWVLGSLPGRLEHIQVSGYTDGGDAVLALPAGTRAMSNLAANTVARNSLGSVKVDDAAPFLKFNVDFVPDAVPQPAPTAGDLHVPQQLTPLFDQIRRELGVRPGGSAESIAAVRRYFAERFRYSLYLGDRGKSLADFLRDSRSGHCEYFATATTLLLRSLGVPARYVVGYSVQEFGQIDKLYLVRQRHAHAWTAAYLDDAWVYVDTTPAIWAEAEAREAESPFTPLYDRLSWLWARFSEWRASESAHTGTWLYAGGLLVCVWLYWRVFRRPRTRREAVEPAAAAALARASPYFEAESEIAPSRSPRSWTCTIVWRSSPASTRARSKSRCASSSRAGARRGQSPRMGKPRQKMAKRGTGVRAIKPVVCMSS